LVIVLISSLIVYPIFDLSQRFFGKGAALITVVIFSVHPLFLCFLSILFGPANMRFTFLFTSFYLIIEGAKNRNIFELLLQAFYWYR
jgi:hypothetical protein